MIRLDVQNKRAIDNIRVAAETTLALRLDEYAEEMKNKATGGKVSSSGH